MTAIAGTRRSMKELVDGTVRVQIDIDPAYRDQFFSMFGKIDMPVALAPLVSDFERQQEKPQTEPAAAEVKTGHWIAALYKSGWFFNPKVLAALGTDEDFRAWVQRQPSCVSGEFSEYIHGEGRSVAAHVRRAGESGTGYKAPYACVPLTDVEHQKQHRDGESAFGGPEWFDKQRAKYVQGWGHELLRSTLEVESLSDTAPEALREWAHDHGVFSTLPLALKG